MFDPKYQLGLDMSILTSKDAIRFFDIDGVLSVYGYGSDGINVCSDDKFDAFIETIDLYKYAVAPDFIREYIEKYTVPENNYVLSQSGSAAQDKQKIVFVNRCYPGLFLEGHILFSRTSDKTEAVRKVLNEMTDGLSTPHIVIDDSISVLSTLQDAGISAVHVSSLLLFAELKKDAKKADETVREVSSGKTTSGSHTVKEKDYKKKKGELSKREISLLNSASSSVAACIVVALAAVYIKSEVIKSALYFLSQICGIYIVFNIALCANYLFSEDDKKEDEEKSIIEDVKEILKDLFEPFDWG